MANEITTSRKNSPCQFQRDGDFMVCQVCGWQMRISDPSLSPEKYHARCGGAEARSENERKLVRPSTAKRSSSPKQRAKKRRTFQLGTLVARLLKRRDKTKVRLRLRAAGRGAESLGPAFSHAVPAVGRRG